MTSAGPAAWPGWGAPDIAGLLTLEPAGPERWRSRIGDANKNGRAYGGQLLGQATMAAHQGIDPERSVTQLQFLFLQGAMPEEAITFETETLQHGRRFTSRHVRGTQGEGRTVCDATLTFALPLESPAHQQPTAAPQEDPEAQATMGDLPAAWREQLSLLGGYSNASKPTIDFRIPEIERQLDPARTEPRLRFWLRAARPLPAVAGMQASAFAYLSDWWLNFCSLGVHRGGLGGGRRLYISSLNHAIWFHRPHRADAWMHFDCSSPAAGSGRGLSVARVHDVEGRLVASATQECLMAYA